MLERHVEARDVDAVRIIDNSVFGAYAEEAAARALAAAGWPPAELAARELVVSARRFHILHQTPAVWGDRLALSVWLRALDETGGEWAIAVQRPDDGAEIASCTLRWTLADRRSGEARRLPASMASALGGAGCSRQLAGSVRMGLCPGLVPGERLGQASSGTDL